jgi:hypothetical protein
MNRLCLSAAIVLMAAPAARADVTPQQVWDEVRALMESYGQTVTVGAEEASGDQLTVRDIVINFEMPDATSSAAIGELRFVDVGDGTVEIVMPPEYRIVSRSEPVPGEAFELEMVVAQAAMNVLVSGDEAEKTYDFGGDSMTITMTGKAGDGTEQPLDATITLASPNGAYLVRTENGGRGFESQFDSASMDVLVNGSDPGTGETFKLTMQLQDLKSTSDGFLPQDASMDDLPAALRAGLKVAGRLDYGANTFGFDGQMDGTQSKAAGSGTTGSFEFAFSPEGLVYGGTGTGTEVRMESSDIPLPDLTFAIEESDFRLAMPITATEEPGDFGLRTTLRGLTLSESIWALVDPMSNLPRDPATIAMDVAGKGRWFIDILDPEAAAAATAAPGEVEEVTLNALELKLAGAELTGSGAFTLDNTDTTTFEGMPRPEGKVDLRLVGGNKLLDTLVAMGLVPEDQAMGARMMLGLFARPGEGEDTLVSTIEVNPAGEVLANGQRLR